MSYSVKNPAWDRMHKTRHDGRIQEEARRANEIQAANPGMSRSAALRQATRELASQLV